MIILKNTTSLDIDLNMGIVLKANAEREVIVNDYILMASRLSTEQLDVLIDNGTIIVNDGTDDLSITEAKAYIRYPDQAIGVRFDNTGTTIDAKNVQDAIKEMSNSAVNLTYGTLDEDILVPAEKALVLVNPIIGDHEIVIEGELVCL